MLDRIIFHADCNNFFASCECLERPELKSVPMAVAGDPENRVGVVVVFPIHITHGTILPLVHVGIIISTLECSVCWKSNGVCSTVS